MSSPFENGAQEFIYYAATRRPFLSITPATLNVIFCQTGRSRGLGYSMRYPKKRVIKMHEASGGTPQSSACPLFVSLGQVL